MLSAATCSIGLSVSWGTCLPPLDTRGQHEIDITRGLSELHVLSNNPFSRDIGASWKHDLPKEIFYQGESWTLISQESYQTDDELVLLDDAMNDFMLQIDSDVIVEYGPGYVACLQMY